MFGEDFSTCQISNKHFGASFGANVGANFGENFGHFVSYFTTYVGNFVQQKGGVNASLAKLVFCIAIP